MKAKKEDVENAILHFAKKYNLLLNYQIILKNSGLPRTVELIVQELFYNNFNSTQCEEEDYKQYKTLHEYSMELKNNGSVRFN